MEFSSWWDRIIIEPLHLSFARMIVRRSQEEAEMLFQAAAVTSDQSLRGHVCARLDALAEMEWSLKDEYGEVIKMPAWDWELLDQQIEQSPMVTVVDDERRKKQPEDAPLIYLREARSMYLGRSWFYEQELAQRIRSRLLADDQPMNEGVFLENIQRLYSKANASQKDQMIAVAHAMDRKFSIIAGGPGTGKTTTVSALLVMRMNQFLAEGKDSPRIMLMAPTGKAAQRLNESLMQALERLALTNEEREALSGIQAGTIHRLLGWTPLAPEQGGPYRHHVRHPLPADIVVVDEASMVDLGLMYRLISAIDDEAQVLLVGDSDQLASVESGCVLGDLCAHSSREIREYLPDTRIAQLRERTGLALDRFSQPSIDPLRASACFLRYSHRFNEASPVGRMAKSIREGDADLVLKILKSDQSQVHWHQQAGEVILRNAAVAQYRDMIQQVSDRPQGALKQLKSLGDYRVLCAHHEGDRGDRSLNQGVHAALASQQAFTGDYFPGTPVMVTANNYRLNLFNGDLGMVVLGENDELMVAFEDHDQEDGLRRVPLVLLQDISLCYAMSIHKSQGSEFHRLVIVLPENASPILTRELLYTGVTRMCDREGVPGAIELYASESVLRLSIESQIRRSSGLRASISDHEYF